MVTEEINKGFDQNAQANAHAQGNAGNNAAPQAQNNVNAQAQPNAGQGQDLGAYIEGIRSSLQKAVDILNQFSSAMVSAQETQRGMNETMQKVLKEVSELRKTIGSVEAENKKQEAERQDAPKEPFVDPGAGETTEHKEVTPSDGELKEKVPGKQTLGIKGDAEAQKSKKIVKTTTTPAPTIADGSVDTDISKAAIKGILSGKIKSAGEVIDFAKKGGKV